MVVPMLWLNCAAVLAGLVIGGFGLPWLAVPAGCTAALLAVLLSSTRRLLRALLPPLLVVAMALYGTLRIALIPETPAAAPAAAAAEAPVNRLVDVRSQLAGAYQEAFGTPSGPLLAALVMGHKLANVPPAVRSDFRMAGLSHALAASGFHLSVLLSSVLLVAGSKPRLRLLLGIVVVFGFVALAGAQPSVVRAALMAGVGLLLLSLGARQRPIGVLALAVITMLLISPVWVQSIGFQFSVVATAGLVISAKPMADGLGRRVPERLALAMAVPLAATCWTVPLQLLHFGRLSPYGIPANLLLTPLLAPLTLVAMAMAPVLLLPAALTGWLLALLGPLLAWVVQVFLLIVHGIAILPWAELPLGQPVPIAAVLLLTAALWWLIPRPAARPGPAPWRQPLLAPLLLAIATALQLQMRFADEIRHIAVPNTTFQRSAAVASRKTPPQSPIPLLVARHQGRAALVSGSPRLKACRRAARELNRLGLDRYDWVVVTYKMNERQQRCWEPLGQTLVRGNDDRLVPGSRLQSPGLVLVPLSSQAHAYGVVAGQRRGRLLIGRAAKLWASGRGAGTAATWPGIAEPRS